jgi:hypothetical protein
MKPVVSVVLVALLVVHAHAKDKEPLPQYDSVAAGGSLDIKTGDPVGLNVKSDAIEFFREKEVKSMCCMYSRHAWLLLSIDPRTVTSLTYGNTKRHRVAEGVAASLGSFGVGLAIMATKETRHYIGLTWEDTKGNKGGEALQVDKKEYRGIIKALEAVTGQHCTDDVTGVQK